MDESTIHIQPYHSPCGDLTLGSLGGRLCLCDWTTQRRKGIIGTRLARILHAGFEIRPSAIIAKAERQLDEYFAGKRTTFDIPLLFAGTAFQKRVWDALLEIPYGETVSYVGLAGLLGKPEAVRATANAIGANAISIFVPCHRIIGSDGTLTGYAGGLDAKKHLLQLEQHTTT